MITNTGQGQLLKLIAGSTDRYADIFVVGLSGANLSTSATTLDFAWASAPITGSYIDTQLNQVVFYGTLAADLAGSVKEIGLVSQSREFVHTGLPNSLVYGFDANESWYSDQSFTISNTASSVGTNNYLFTNAVANQYLAKNVVNINVSRYDTVKFKINSANVSTIRLVLKNDELNYAWKDIALTNGDNFVTQSLSSFTKQGSFDPLRVSEIRFVVQNVSNSTNFLEFDALTFLSQENGGLITRNVLATTMYKRPGAEMELEYAVAM